MSEIDPKFDGGTDDRLKRALRNLAATSQDSAPAEIGGGLTTAFRRHHAKRKRIRRISIAGLVACIMAVAGLFFLRAPHRAENTTQAQVERVIAPAKAPEVTQTASVPKQRSTAVRKSTQARVAPSTVAYSREFVALPAYNAAIPTDDLHIVRVQLPTSTLWQMGAPINPAAPDRRVLADFVVGQDGTPYGVRLVQ